MKAPAVLIRSAALYFASVLSTTVLACPSESGMRAEALRVLYADSEVVAYVCMERNRCSFAEFSGGLEVTSARLGQAKPSSPRLGIKVEPQHKGLQYFTSLFVLEQCRYRLIFAGDISLSGVKLLRQQRGGFYLLRAYERGSNSAWKEYDYSYDRAARDYRLIKTRCYEADGNGTALAVTCNQ